MTRFSTHAENMLRQAGWYPGRQVPELVATWKANLILSDSFELFPSAEQALLEFGGLSFNERGPGVTAAREPFTLDPMLAAYEADRFTDFANELSTTLFPLGEAAGGRYFLAIPDKRMTHQQVKESTTKAFDKIVFGSARRIAAVSHGPMPLSLLIKHKRRHNGWSISATSEVCVNQGKGGITLCSPF